MKERVGVGEEPQGGWGKVGTSGETWRKYHFHLFFFSKRTLSFIVFSLFNIIQC